MSEEDTRDGDGVCVSCVRLQVLTAQDLVDFSPVYRCLHIYTILVGPGLTLHSRLWGIVSSLWTPYSGETHALLIVHRLRTHTP